MTGITLCMVVRNEGRLLKKLLPKVHKLFDKILAMDQASTDNTAEVLKSYGAEVITTTRKNLADIDRQTLYEFVQTDWVFVLDADERPSKDLKKFLKKHRKDPDPNIDVYHLPFKNLIDSVDAKEVLGDDFHPRLWRARMPDKQPTLIWPQRAHTFPRINSPRQLWMDFRFNVIHERTWKRVREVHEKRMMAIDPQMQQIEAQFLNKTADLLRRHGKNV